MGIFETIIIAIVEGLTEFLPVSSTGHMIIAQNVLGVESTDFVKAFTFIIQFGAILSVVCLYWKKFFHLNEVPQGVTGAKAFLIKYDFYWKLLVAFLPAAVFGLLFSDAIDAMLERVEVVAITLVLGGIFMLFCDKIFGKGTKEKMTERNALMVGLYQCISMIPGVSRSMATIVGGMSQGLTRKAAAEFSFFLAVPTMLAATAYKLLKLIMDPVQRAVLVDNMTTLIVGNVVAFIVALLAIKFFIEFVSKYGFKAFGWYRIIVGGAIIVMMLCGVSLEI
ncbi:MAG: undecaprenyl-diphosphate phosphatase [Muribaculaceae bacterium]|jgi:undecaprenyl-diphosphatase|nr:undecaprenyl-diphosphate phosphatase [Muribaculaceae bacterium]MBQ1185639.1 undecaprenyl-diphosphate phosphatase [Muribaculaceae bacterium]MBQ2371303.1 undecaprenyl-diphosphate phosphatase [Muribaculaceae bacterium]MBQ2399513.1 undecaprenyl-diphosphate phosphatase [Muribaculaceae bacterium]MBQ2440278.1 undecaprenyl-diphosphate phosphatase [Muribaculaceae bacterium]